MVQTKCPRCDGNGRVIGFPKAQDCPLCGGTGYVDDGRIEFVIRNDDDYRAQREEQRQREAKAYADKMYVDRMYYELIEREKRDQRNKISSPTNSSNQRSSSNTNAENRNRENIKTSNRDPNSQSSSWLKKGATSIGILALIAILGAIFYVAWQTPGTTITVPAVTVPENPYVTTSSAPDTYTVKVNYGGTWSGSIKDSQGTTPISGTGPLDIKRQFSMWPVNVHVSKTDMESGTLTVEVSRSGRIIKRDSIPNIHGSLDISASG